VLQFVLALYCTAQSSHLAPCQAFEQLHWQFGTSPETAVDRLLQSTSVQIRAHAG
jgi:hypothetical protein